MSDIPDRIADSVEYRIGYQQGRIDTLNDCWEKYNKMGYGFFEDWLAEQLKEKDNV